MDSKKSPILNIDALQYRDVSHGQKFSAKVGDISGKLGASKLGYNLCVVPPGKRAFPRHNHFVNEEVFFVVEGKGEVIVGDERFPIREGDVIASPAGDSSTAHQIVNTSESDLRYLALSTKLAPEIVEYPDSQKFGVAGAPPGPPGAPPKFKRFMVRNEATDKEYWEGED